MANKDASDFMLQEYEQIAQAYFRLGEQLNQWFRNYLSLVALPLTFLGAILQLSDSGPLPKLTDLPELVAGLLVVIGVLGLLVMLAVIFTRLDMVMYARTINRVRAYFSDQLAAAPPDADGLEATSPLQKYLVLPLTDQLPPFYEANHSIYVIVLMVGVVNGIVFFLGVINLLSWSIWLLLPGIVVSVLLHWSIYRLLAERRERNWRSGRAIPT